MTREKNTPNAASRMFLAKLSFKLKAKYPAESNTYELIWNKNSEAVIIGKLTITDLNEDLIDQCWNHLLGQVATAIEGGVIK